MLFPMLKGSEDGLFQGRGPNGKTYDWKAWDGTPNGYEGLLVDNYMTLLAVLARWSPSLDLRRPGAGGLLSRRHASAGALRFSL